MKKRFSISVNQQAVILGLIPMLIFGLLASRSLWLPGIYYDEVLQAVPAISALEGTMDGPVIQVEGSVIRAMGRSFPLMILPYLGATQAGVLTLSFALADISVPVMRGTFIALGALGLIFTFLFTRRLFNLGTALLSTLFLAVDPTFIFALRSDNGPTAIMMICKMGALWLLLIWWQSRKPLFLILGAFLCGFGLYDKVNFIWFLGALGVAVGLIYPRQLWERLRSTRWTALLGAAASFCTGASILLAYTLITGGGPFRGLFNLTQQETTFGVDNTNLLSNLSVRLQSLYGLLSGYEILDFYTSTFGGYHYLYNRDLFPTTALPWIVGMAIIVLGLQIVLRFKDGLNQRKVLFLLCLTGLIVVASTVTPTNLMYHHLLLLYPFPHLVAAHFVMVIPRIIEAGRRSGGEIKAGQFLGSGTRAAVIVLVLLTNLGVVANYYRVLEETGGIGMWSDTIYELADYLEGDERTIVAMDWGINLNLLTLSQGELATLEPWQDFLYTSGYSPEMEALISEPGQIYVFHAPKYSGVLAINQQDFPRETFFSTVGAIGAEAILEKSFTQRNGDLLFELYTVSHQGTDGSEAELITSQSP